MAGQLSQWPVDGARAWVSKWMAPRAGLPMQRWAAFLLVTPLLALPVGFAVWLGYEDDIEIIVTIDLLAYSLVALTLLGSHLRFYRVLSFLILGLLLIGDFITLRYGSFRPMVVLAANLPLVAAVFFDRRAGGVALALTGLALLYIASMIANGQVPVGMHETNLIGRWIVLTLCILLLAGCLMLGFWMLSEGLATESQARRAAESARDRISEAAEQSPGLIMLIPLEHRAEPYRNLAARSLALDPDLIRAHSAWEQVVGGASWTGEIESVDINGKAIVLAGVLAPVRDVAGRVTDVMVSMTDIAAERAMEARLRQDERLAAMGTLAGGIAHDFNNLLQPILGGAELVASLLPKEHAGQEPLAEIVRAGSSARDLIERLLAFVNADARERLLIDVAQIVTGSESLLRAVVPRRVDIRTRVTGPAPITGRANDLQQILLNLCMNSAEAMPDGGTIDIRVARVASKTLSETERPTGSHEETVIIEVRDTGPGFEESLLDRVFEPFFTTKPGRMGAGLGLSAARTAITAIGGTITASNLPQGGALVRLCLPVAEVPDDVVTLATELVGQEAGGTVLLVDDDELVRKSIHRALEQIGWTVVSCRDPRAAMTEVGRSSRKFDVLLTDYNMPGGASGLQLAKAARAVRPGLPVVVMTGLLEFPPGTSEVTGILHKPVKIAELQAELSRVKQKQAQA